MSTLKIKLKFKFLKNICQYILKIVKIVPENNFLEISLMQKVAKKQLITNPFGKSKFKKTNFGKFRLMIKKNIEKGKEKEINNV
jgi:hypothetical protein